MQLNNTSAKTVVSENICSRFYLIISDPFLILKRSRELKRSFRGSNEKSATSYSSSVVCKHILVQDLNAEDINPRNNGNSTNSKYKSLYIQKIQNLPLNLSWKHIQFISRVPPFVLLIIS